MSTKLTRHLDRGSRYADKLYGLNAVFINRASVSVDITTGEQTAIETKSNVRIRPWSLSVREQIDFSAAGYMQIDARWTMRVAYASTVEPGDILQVGAFYYEIIPNGVNQDEHAVEWQLLTRRRK